MLKELAKRDSEWRKIALKICGCSTLADDLVQEMYLKLYDLKKDQINRHYVSYAIYHLFINHNKKQQKTKYIEDTYIKENFTEPCEKLNGRILINDALKELSLVDREILLHTHEGSLRNKENELGISKDILWNRKNNALEKLKETETIKKIIAEQWKE